MWALTNPSVRATWLASFGGKFSWVNSYFDLGYFTLHSSACSGWPQPWRRGVESRVISRFMADELPVLGRQTRVITSAVTSVTKVEGPAAISARKGVRKERSSRLLASCWRRGYNLAVSRVLRGLELPYLGRKYRAAVLSVTSVTQLTIFGSVLATKMGREERGSEGAVLSRGHACVEVSSPVQ